MQHTLKVACMCHGNVSSLRVSSTLFTKQAAGFGSRAALSSSAWVRAFFSSEGFHTVTSCRMSATRWAPAAWPMTTMAFFMWAAVIHVLASVQQDGSEAFDEGGKQSRGDGHVDYASILSGCRPTAAHAAQRNLVHSMSNGSSEHKTQNWLKS